MCLGVLFNCLNRAAVKLWVLDLEDSDDASILAESFNYVICMKLNFSLSYSAGYVLWRVKLEIEFEMDFVRERLRHLDVFSIFYGELDFLLEVFVILGRVHCWYTNPTSF